jgi:hypothetical protein
LDSWARAVRWLCWALVVFAIVNAVITIGFALGIGAPNIDKPDLVDRLEAFRADDTRIFAVVLIQSLSGAALFFVAAMLGTALRKWAPDSPARDAMVMFFVVGGVIGVVAGLVSAAVGNMATFGICDCGYRTEELVGQDKAMILGNTIGNWLSIGGVLLVGLGAAVGGRLLNLSSAWRMLSYAIAGLLLLAVVVRLVASFFFIAAFDPFQVSNILGGLAGGILVPIWAYTLSRLVQARAAA